MSEGAEGERRFAADFGSESAGSAQDRLGRLRDLVSRLRAIVTAYEVNPESAYSGLAYTGEMIGAIHEEMRFLFDNDRGLLNETDWTAFRREEQQYTGMYTASWKTMGVYKAAESYNPLRAPNVRPPPKPVEVPRLIENDTKLGELLWDYLRALRYLHGKVDAMLGFLPHDEEGSPGMRPTG
jgi:hypothetical protein